MLVHGKGVLLWSVLLVAGCVGRDSDSASNRMGRSPRTPATRSQVFIRICRPDFGGFVSTGVRATRYADAGDSLRPKEVRRDFPALVSAALRRFGTWSAAVEAALPGHQGRKV